MVRRVALEPGEVLRVVGRVRDGEVLLLAQPVGEEVVQDAPVLPAEHGVLGAADGDLLHVVGEQALQEGGRARPGGPDLPHVRDVEDARRAAHGQVLLADPAVLHRHLPAREGHELGARLDVLGEQGGAAQGVGIRGHGRRRTLPAGPAGGPAPGARARHAPRAGALRPPARRTRRVQRHARAPSRPARPRRRDPGRGRRPARRGRHRLRLRQGQRLRAEGQDGQAGRRGAVRLARPRAPQRRHLRPQARRVEGPGHGHLPVPRDEGRLAPGRLHDPPGDGDAPQGPVGPPVARSRKGHHRTGPAKGSRISRPRRRSPPRASTSASTSSSSVGSRPSRARRSPFAASASSARARIQGSANWRIQKLSAVSHAT
ncbi:MAG: hypothetical protein AVDCRST_MAG13-3006 [uncultured Solirubrobacteraceae bacterium]|uniref:Uncharacterized protein n=1 Tax=uncultured Solirubrobacteraceae bacterium TaxID=1162706 RepID=A0A6J4T5J7_9ACTN|nr:MAG: hypothetical protein AVDCRST_MAG13-3006 [uncultured Solirubrobacteraceae bacterium]